MEAKCIEVNYMIKFILHSTWAFKSFHSCKNGSSSKKCKSYRYELLNQVTPQDRDIHHTLCCDSLSWLQDDKLFTTKLSLVMNIYEEMLTGDKIWSYSYDPETKQQLSQ
jgi:hypothetical protein